MTRAQLPFSSQGGGWAAEVPGLGGPQGPGDKPASGPAQSGQTPGLALSGRALPLSAPSARGRGGALTVWCPVGGRETAMAAPGEGWVAGATAQPPSLQAGEPPGHRRRCRRARASEPLSAPSHSPRTLVLKSNPLWVAGFVSFWGDLLLLAPVSAAPPPKPGEAECGTPPQPCRSQGAGEGGRAGAPATLPVTQPGGEDGQEAGEACEWHLA